MPLGVGIGQVVGLVRETRALEDATPWIAVAGDGAAELAAALAAGGDAGGRPRRRRSRRRRPSRSGCSTATPSAAEAAVLRRLSRAGARRDRRPARERAASRTSFPATSSRSRRPRCRSHALVAAIARAAGDDGPALAARLPVLRPAVAGG